jgi:hypothetical protein
MSKCSEDLIKNSSSQSVLCKIMLYMFHPCKDDVEMHILNRQESGRVRHRVKNLANIKT